ncbi:hypothetical protein V8G54_018928 [Vigna mungo]|uniref:Uncharacterized protein n=1 Tax=Vigna mungo TaxID=3915 RepID=A0AAQ3RT57_VIGMU
MKFSAKKNTLQESSELSMAGLTLAQKVQCDTDPQNVKLILPLSRSRFKIKNEFSLLNSLKYLAKPWPWMTINNHFLLREDFLFEPRRHGGLGKRTRRRISGV